jgi:pSer/pThr/pTyr-binding forkhead associated (FHA) protein
MAVVLVFKTDDQILEIPLLGKISVGRSSSCELPIVDKQMSGKHGAFEFNREGQVFYTDLGSTNGSFLNNSQIHKTIFKLNDVIKLGNTTVTIDEKKLSSRERLVIGRTNLKADDDQTLMVSSISRTNSVVRGSAPLPTDEPEKPSDKKTVMLNKDLKKKTVQPKDWSGRPDEKLIEQEESSGKTKMLKLDIGLKKKK